MRTAGLIALVAFCFLLAPAGADEKQPTKEPPAKAPMKEAPDKPPIPEFRSALDEVEGKTLEQWVADLHDGDPSVREKAISIIPAYGPSASSQVPKLVLVCKRDEDLGPRSKAIMALGIMEIQKEDVAKVVEVMSEILEKRGEDLAAKLQAALTLTRFGNEEAGRRAIPALIAGVNDSGSWQIRKASILALRRIGGDKKDGPHRDVSLTLAFRAKRDQAFQVRIEAIQALGYMGPPKDATTYASVRKTLEELTNVNDNAKANDTILAIWSHVSLMALDKVTEKQLKEITKHLTSSQLAVRGEAVLALGTLGLKAKAAVPNLLAMLKDKDLGVALLACWALVSVGDKDAKVIDAMEELANKKDLDPRAKETVKAAIEVLKNSKKAEFVEPKKDGKPDVKTQPKTLPRR
jgi:HEAT repeat protein